MIAVELSGGLGNQMFQVATAASMAKSRNTEFILSTKVLDDRSDKSHFTYRNFSLGAFGLEKFVATNPYQDMIPYPEDNLIKKLKRRIYGIDIYFEKDLLYDSSTIQLGTHCYINGYFQSERYFNINQEYIKSMFTVKTELSNLANQLIEKNRNEEAIGVHIRRGDYVTDSVINSVHGVMDVDYYLEAIDLITAKRNPGSLIFFSDDPEWVEEHLLDKTSVKGYISKGLSAIEDLELMRSCSHFITANSSFSWWGAWLGEKSKSVIVAPVNWFKDPNRNSTDIIPARWIRI